MSSRNLIILAVAAAVMLSWAIIQSYVINRQVDVASQSGPLIQGLETGDIDRIELGAGEEAVTLKRQDQGFVLANKDNYPVQIAAINELITNCLEIQTAELVTGSSTNHEDLEVTEDKGRQVVKFFNKDDIITGVVVGKYTEQGAGSYIRRVNSDNVYLTSQSPYLKTGALDYIESKILAVIQDEIKQVQVTTDQGDYILLQEPNETIVLASSAGERPPQLKQTEAGQVYTALSSLYLTDVRQASAETDQFEFKSTYQCRLKDSTAYIFQVASRDGKYYLKCRAIFADQTPVTMDRTKIESEEELKRKEAKLLAHEAAQKFAAEHQGWVYEIASWKGENLTKNLADLIEK
jgi:hypothetical protein